MARVQVHGVKICKEAPIISHQPFANDCFLFFYANSQEIEMMNDILKSYDEAIEAKLPRLF